MQDNSTTALLIMDVQPFTVGMIKDLHPTLTTTLSETIVTARAKNVKVMYVVVGFRKGYPEISVSNKGFAAAKNSGRNLDTPEAMQVDASLAPNDDEPVIVKKRVSAFAGSDLEVLLRANGIRHMVLAGIATSGVVLSTLREAADKDYQVTVLHDCCADGDAEVHRVLTTKVFPRQAEVMSHTEWMDKL